MKTNSVSKPCLTDKNPFYAIALRGKSEILLASTTLDSESPHHVFKLPKAELAFAIHGNIMPHNMSVEEYLCNLETELIGKSVIMALHYVSERIYPFLKDGESISILAAKGLDARFCDIQKESIITQPLPSLWCSEPLDSVVDFCLCNNDDIPFSPMDINDMKVFAIHIFDIQRRCYRYKHKLPFVGGRLKFLIIKENGPINVNCHLAPTVDYTLY